MATPASFSENSGAVTASSLEHFNVRTLTYVDPSNNGDMKIVVRVTSEDQPVSCEYIPVVNRDPPEGWLLSEEDTRPLTSIQGDSQFVKHSIAMRELAQEWRESAKSFYNRRNTRPATSTNRASHASSKPVVDVVRDLKLYRTVVMGVTADMRNKLVTLEVLNASLKPTEWADEMKASYPEQMHVIDAYRQAEEKSISLQSHKARVNYLIAKSLMDDTLWNKSVEWIEDNFRLIFRDQSSSATAERELAMSRYREVMDRKQLSDTRGALETWLKNAKKRMRNKAKVRKGDVDLDKESSLQPTPSLESATEDVETKLTQAVFGHSRPPRESNVLSFQLVNQISLSDPSSLDYGILVKQSGENGAIITHPLLPFLSSGENACGMEVQPTKLTITPHDRHPAVEHAKAYLKLASALNSARESILEHMAQDVTSDGEDQHNRDDNAAFSPESCCTALSIIRGFNEWTSVPEGWDQTAGHSFKHDPENDRLVLSELAEEYPRYAGFLSLWGGVISANQALALAEADLIQHRAKSLLIDPGDDHNQITQAISEREAWTKSIKADFDQGSSLLSADWIANAGPSIPLARNLRELKIDWEARNSTTDKTDQAHSDSD